MSTPKKHHFLPQFYLERFRVDPSDTKYPRVWVVTKEQRPRSYCAAIHDTACIADYNTVDFRDQPPDRQRVEGFLSRVDFEHSLVLARTIDLSAIAPKDLPRICAFVSLTNMRVPKFKAHIESVLRTSVQSLGDHMLETGQFPPMPESLRKLGPKCFRELIRVEISNWIVLDYMLEAALNSQFASFLSQMSIGLRPVPPEGALWTCDSPVAIFHPDYSQVRPYGVGLLTQNAELSLPLSPRLLLVARNSRPAPAGPLSLAEVAEYNRRTVVMADRYVYTHRADEEVLRSVGAHSGEHAGFRLDELQTTDESALIARYIPVQPDRS